MKAFAKKTNLTVIFFTLFLFVIIITGYVVQVIKGIRGISAIVFLIVTLLLIYSVVFAIYRQDSDSKKIRYMLILGILIPYGYTLFISTSTVAFAFIVPVFVITFMFFDRKLLSILTVMVLTMNVYFIIKLSLLGIYEGNSTDLLLTISILVALLVGCMFA